MLTSSNGHSSALLAFCAGISPVTGEQDQCRGALVLICAWTGSSANNENAGNLRRHRAQYDVIVMHEAGEFLNTSRTLNTAGATVTKIQLNQYLCLALWINNLIHIKEWAELLIHALSPMAV